MSVHGEGRGNLLFVDVLLRGKQYFKIQILYVTP